MNLSSLGSEFFIAPSNSIWITPGINFNSTIPIIKDFNSIWIYSWMNFYKHSAIFQKLDYSNSQLFEF